MERGYSSTFYLWAVRLGSGLTLISVFIPMISLPQETGLTRYTSLGLLRSGQFSVLLVIATAIILFGLTWALPSGGSERARFLWFELGLFALGLLGWLLPLIGYVLIHQMSGGLVSLRIEWGGALLCFGSLWMGIGVVLDLHHALIYPLEGSSESDNRHTLPKLGNQSNVRGTPLPATPPIGFSPEPKLPRAGLQVIRSVVRGPDIPINREEFCIGRGIDNDLQLLDITVSRRHARLCYSHGNWFIQDRGSKFGIYVNQQKVNASPLRNGDRIVVGDNLFVFQVRDPRILNHSL